MWYPDRRIVRFHVRGDSKVRQVFLAVTTGFSLAAGVQMLWIGSGEIAEAWGIQGYGFLCLAIPLLLGGSGFGAGVILANSELFHKSSSYVSPQ